MKPVDISTVFVQSDITLISAVIEETDITPLREQLIILTVNELHRTSSTEALVDPASDSQSDSYIEPELD